MDKYLTQFEEAFEELREVKDERPIETKQTEETKNNLWCNVRTTLGHLINFRVQDAD
jgi:hypothetical protein